MQLAPRRALLPLFLILAALLGGCEKDSSGEDRSYALGVPVWAASCKQWRTAGPQERQASLAEMEDVRNQQLSGRGVGRGYGSVLDDNVAYRLFDERCKTRGSDNFLLYRLYGFAAGFAGQPAE